MPLYRVEDDARLSLFRGIRQKNGSELTLDHQRNCSTWLSLIAFCISSSIKDGYAIDINIVVQSILDDYDLISTTLERALHQTLLQHLAVFFTPEILAELPKVSRIAYEIFIEDLEKPWLSLNNRKLCSLVRMFQSYLIENNLEVENVLELTRSLENAVLQENY